MPPPRTNLAVLVVALLLVGIVCFVVVLPHHSLFYSSDDTAAAGVVDSAAARGRGSAKTEDLKRQALGRIMRKSSDAAPAVGIVAVPVSDGGAALGDDDDDSHAAAARLREWFPDEPAVFDEDARRDTWSEPALLRDYNASRPHRACEPLPSDVTIQQSDKVVLGVISESKMPAWREQQLRKNTSSASSKHQQRRRCRDAFVFMVSNHRYVDGALVAAASLWNTSALLRRKRACVVMLTSEKLHPDSVRQLTLVFDVVKVLRTLGSFVPRSYYKTTFDKAYLWSALTEYRHVMFLDADHLVSNAAEIEALLTSAGTETSRKGKNKNKNKKAKKDSVYRHGKANQEDAEAPSSSLSDEDDDGEAEGDDAAESADRFPENRIAAVGDHGYFQTGLMVIKPSRQVFVDLYLEFRYGTFATGGKMGGYNQWRARDGILIRNCFLKHVDGIAHPGGLHHFYGYFKPWFDASRQRKITKEAIEFSAPYRRWWERYVELHRTVFAAMPRSGIPMASDEDDHHRRRRRHAPSSARIPYGGIKAHAQQVKEQKRRQFRCRPGDGPDVVNPLCFMWLQRHRETEEYLTPVPGEAAQRWWDLSVPSLAAVVGDATATSTPSSASTTSCNAVCAKKNLVCRDDALRWTSVGTCAGLRARRGWCSRKCVEVEDGGDLPRASPDAAHDECWTHSFLSHRALPRCDAPASAGTVRVCPCVERGEQNSTAHV